MTLHKNHPARSHDFLSRLHDGELEPSERAHFEAHRAHCKECRDAAADFERALSLFRSSRSSPPPSDLAMRVLRKVQTHATSRRTPFGDLFSVDLRWAGAFAAALLVLLVGAPIVLRQQEERKAVTAGGPIPVELQRPAEPPTDKTTDKASGAIAGYAQPQAPAARNARAPGRVNEDASAVYQNRGKAAGQQAEARPKAGVDDDKLTDRLTEENFKREEKLVKNDEAGAAKPALAEKAQAQAPAPPASAARPAPALGDSRSQASNANRQLAAAQAPPVATAPEAQGGEGARDQANFNEVVLDRPARIVVQPFDALGSAPALDARSQGPGLNELRGRSFIVVVDGQGRVVDAQETISKKLQAEGRRRDPALAKEKDKEKDNPTAASAALKSLRFQAGERQRKLLIRVE